MLSGELPGAEARCRSAVIPFNIHDPTFNVSHSGKMPKTEGFAAADSAWWRMEDPTNLMMITGVLTFDRAPDFGQASAALKTRLADRWDRFRMRVVEGGLPLIGGIRWEEDPEFTMAYHLQRTRLDEPGDRDALQRRVSELMSMPLDYERPLWQMHYVENYEHGGAIIVRLHHCIADGMALVEVLLSLDEKRGRKQPRRKTRLPAINGRTHSALEPVLNLTGQVLAPFRTTLGIMGVLTKLAAMGADVDSVFRGPLGRKKVAVWSDPIPLETIKRVGKKLGGTVNDVLLSTVAGALRIYMDGRGRDLEHGETLRAVVPVNLRRADEPLTLGNRFGTVFLTLPVGTWDPVERLHALKHHMDRLKRSPEAAVIFGLLQLLGKTAERLLVAVVNLLGRNATAVMTNVPGPSEPVTFLGQPIRSLMFWVPQSGKLGLGVSVLSYCGQVRIGVATDAGLVPDPERIIEAYHQALAALLERADESPAPVA
jgi:diacylglycerol O-acyltransferase / wax synthase